MSGNQTEEEKQLIAKWNAGEYSAQGWVVNTESLTDEARKGLAEYNAKTLFSGENCEENLESALFKDENNIDIAASALPRNFTTAVPNNATLTVGIIGGTRVRATVRLIGGQGFAPNFSYFRAEFPNQTTAVSQQVDGIVTWVTSQVSSTLSPTILEVTPTTPRRIIITSRLGTSPRLQFVANSSTNTPVTMTNTGAFYR